LIRQSIARSYAKGLFAAGVHQGKYEDYLRQVKEILEIVNERPKIRRALTLPFSRWTRERNCSRGL